MPVRIEANSDYRTFANVTQYEIRAMTFTDLPTVIQIDRATWDDKSWPTEHFLGYLYDSSDKCWILEDKTVSDNPIVGYGFQRLYNKYSHITNLCIHPNQRGHGLGGMLLRHMINYAGYLGIPIIELEVDTSNTHAYTLYYKHGFRIIQYLERYYSEINDAYRMQLSIDLISK